MAFANPSRVWWAVNDRVFTNKRPRSRRDSTAPVAHHVRKCWAREAIKAYHRHQADRRRKLVQHGARHRLSVFQDSQLLAVQRLRVPAIFRAFQG